MTPAPAPRTTWGRRLMGADPIATGRGPLRTLVGTLGATEALRVMTGVARRALTDRPFSHLPKSVDRRERLSRAQARPAILLYRTLLDRLAPERALAVATDVIAAGAVDHLRRTLRGFDASTFATLDDGAQRAQVEAWVDAFFTAETEINAVSSQEVSFTVQRCALVRLSQAAGHPELAPSFCVGDAHFFAHQRPPVRLDRPQTLAEGGSCCPFTLHMAAETDAQI